MSVAVIVASLGQSAMARTQNSNGHSANSVLVVQMPAGLTALTAALAAMRRKLV